MNTPNQDPAHAAFDALFAQPKKNTPQRRPRFTAPMTNGENGSSAPTSRKRQRRAIAAAPIANGENGAHPSSAPIANGENGVHPSSAPMTNGENGAAASTAPIAIGENGEYVSPLKGIRDKAGRWAACNPGGPGNPFARRTAQLRKALCEAVSAEEMAALGRVLLQKATEGDMAAAKLLLAYAVGRPADVVNPDTLDFQEWQHFQQVPASPGVVHQILNCLPTEFACQLIRILLPNTEFQIKEKFIKKWEGDDRRNVRNLRRRAAKKAASPDGTPPPSNPPSAPPSEPPAAPTSQPVFDQSEQLSSALPATPPTPTVLDRSEQPPSAPPSEPRPPRVRERSKQPPSTPSILPVSEPSAQLPSDPPPEECTEQACERRKRPRSAPRTQ
jgi:hypothetical protein